MAEQKTEKVICVDCGRPMDQPSFMTQCEHCLSKIEE